VEEVRTALWLERGNVTNSALRLKVTSARLRRFIDSSPRLQAEQREAREQLLDRAEEIVHEALNDPADPGRRDGMTKFLLNSAMAKQRGYGSGPSTQVNVKNTGPMIIGWLTEEKAMPGDTARDVTPQEAAE
jgi:hypothetical protein